MVLCGVFCMIILCSTTGAANAQYQSTSPRNNNQMPVNHSPSRAAMLSATMPGLGQVYNKKYWKVPVIYAGFGALVYFIDFNNSGYQMWREAWVARVDGNPNTIDDFPAHSADALERNMNFYRRNLEITYILTAALYLLNVLDASVDAHLMHFDVGEDLSLGMGSRDHQMASRGIPSQNSPQLTLRLRF